MRKIVITLVIFCFMISLLNAQEALFDVKNDSGVSIFTVYPGGIKIMGMSLNADDSKIWIDDAEGQQLFVASQDSVRFYLYEDPGPTDESRGGFAIATVGSTSDELGSNFMNLTPDNYFIGHEAGEAITSGLYNTFIGYTSGATTSTGNNNLFLGYESGLSNTEGVNNVFMGFQSGKENIGIGAYNGDYNVFIGYRSGMNNNSTGVSGQSNVFIGEQCGKNNTSGRYNLFLGAKTGLWNETGVFNTYIGSQAGQANHFGINNTFVGYCSGYRDTASNNTFIGYWSANWHDTGEGNTFLGNKTGYSNASGEHNTLLGHRAGYWNETGSGNVFLGSFAATNEMGSNKLYIENSDSATPLIYGEFDNDIVTINGDLNITNDDGDVDLTLDGNAADDAFTMTFCENGVYKASFGWQSLNNYVFLYEGGTNSLVSRGGKIGIGNVNPIYKLELQNNSNYYIGKARAYSWTTYSDGRLKKNRSSLKYGLNEILKLNPLEYDHHSSTNENGQLEILDDSEHTIGLIAQEVNKIIPEAVNEPTEEHDLWCMDYEKLIPVLIKGMQEQQKLIEELNGISKDQQKTIDNLNDKIGKLEETIIIK